MAMQTHIPSKVSLAVQRTKEKDWQKSCEGIACVCQHPIFWATTQTWR